VFSGSNKNLIRKEPKTAAGVSIIPLDENLIELLEQQCFQRGLMTLSSYRRIITQLIQEGCVQFGRNI
jgi:hypothetical protein